MKKNVGFLGVLLCTVLVLALSFLNMASVPFSLLGATSMDVPAGMLVITGYLLGLAATLSLLMTKVITTQASGKRLESWDAQDQKLLQQVQSDKEKQLEAKIETLEVALQKALNK